MYECLLYSYALFFVMILSYELINVAYTTKPSYYSTELFLEAKRNHLNNVRSQLFKFVMYLFVIALLFCKKNGNILNLKHNNFNYTTSSGSQGTKICNLIYNFYNYLKTVLEEQNILIAIILLYLCFDYDNKKIVNVLLAFLEYFILHRFILRNRYFVIFVFLRNEWFYRAWKRSIGAKIIDICTKDNLPKEIIDFIEGRGFVFNVRDIESTECNIYVVSNLKIATIYVCNKVHNLMSQQEFLSLLYHEVGHIVTYTCLKKTVINFLIFFIPSFSFTKYFLKPTTISYLKTLTALEITEFALKILGCGFIFFGQAYESIQFLFTFFDEIKADKFSVGMYPREYLKQGIIKMCMENRSVYDCSLLYNLFLTSHPALKRRLKMIENY